MSADELVLVVPRGSIVNGAGWHGIRATAPGRLLEAVARFGRFERRSSAEDDPGLKQVIPYLVLRDGPRWFLMRRTRAGGDPRLHDRQSIGVGGHLNPGDVDVAGGLSREWAEELAADFVPAFRFVGLLNDDTTEVGRVHVGAVYEADAGGRPVTVRETDKLEGRFVETAAVVAAYDSMETWSQLAFDHLAGRPG